MRGQLSILSEAYSYATYENRVLATREFIREILGYVVEKREDALALHESARADAVRAGATLQPDDLVGLRYRVAAFTRPIVQHGWEYAPTERRRPQPTDVPKDYTVVHNGRFEPTVSVRRPYAYVIEPGLDAVVEKLRQHGIIVEPFSGDAHLESYLVTEMKRARREFQGHRLLTLEVEARATTAAFTDAHVVRLAQPLGNLAAYLLEPQATDGLAAWNFLDDTIAVQEMFPIRRVLTPKGLR